MSDDGLIGGCDIALSQQNSAALEHHGTCATTITGTPGIAFIIDSRITVTRSNELMRQYPGCKVLLARPTILLAGVGLEDRTGVAGRWNSLDAASVALQSVPNDPTPEQLDKWALTWKTTLERHFREGGEKPDSTGIVSEMLLITRVKGLPYFSRVTAQWDGSHFLTNIFGEAKYDEPPNVQYSGSCRNWVVHTNEHLPPTIPRTSVENIRLSYWGSRKLRAKTITDLADTAYGFESVLTDIDRRIEGDKAGIAPPYASAEWPNDSKGWIVNFNSECTPIVDKPSDHLPIMSK